MIITAEQTGNHVIQPESGGPEIACKKAKFEGTEKQIITQFEHEQAAAGGQHLNGTFTHVNSSLTNTSATLTPTYSECTAFGFAATVTTTGCHDRFTAETNASGQGQVHTECEAGKAITISAGGCELFIGSQTPAGGGKYTNEGGGTLKAEINLTGISYTTNGSFACTILGIKAASTGIYNGNVVMKAFEDEGPTNTGTYKEVKQLSITKGPTV